MTIHINGKTYHAMYPADYVAELRAQLDALAPEVEALRAENADLRHQLANARAWQRAEGRRAPAERSVNRGNL
jgi:regulator of replication initiation timing